MEAEISNENSKSISQNKINQLEIKNSNDGQSVNKSQSNADESKQISIEKQEKTLKKGKKKGKKKKKVLAYYYPPAQAPNVLLSITDQVIKLDKTYILREAYAQQIIDNLTSFQKYLKRQNKDSIEEEFPEEEKEQSNLNEVEKVNEVQAKLDAVKDIKITKIQNVDILRKKTSNDEYVLFEDWKKDLNKLFDFTKKYRCESDKSLQYMDELWNVLEIKFERWEKNYMDTKRNDLSQLFKKDLDWKIECNNWPQIPKYFRQYEEIYEYVIPESESKVQIEKILKTNLSASDCEDNCQCTGPLESIGEFDYETGGWKSECLNKERSKIFNCQHLPRVYLERIECNAGSEYHRQNCKNRGITEQQRKILSVDVDECWC